MNRHLFSIAFFLGLAAILWVGAGFIGGHVLALMMTTIIGAVYLFGALELRQFRQESASLSAALAAIPEQLSDLGDWLAGVPASLQNPVRLRIEGDRIGLPAPALTPYLVGLLVMLGMLGTFLGMVVTLNGAAFSLEGTTDLQTIRTALAAPIKGLGLAFGTSVAGVAASAMLGLMSALSRRERMQVAQLLDTHIGNRLRGFSLKQQRQEAYQALRSQAQALPEVVTQLQAMMTQMERSSQQLNEQLLTHQNSFHHEVKGMYRDLAASVAQSLTQSAQTAGERLQPVIETTMAGLAQEARLMHQRMIEAAQTQVDGLSSQLGATTATVTQAWTAALANHERSNTSMASALGDSLNAFSDKAQQSSESLLSAISNGHTQLLTQQALSDERRQQAWQTTLSSVATTLQHEWQQADEQTHAQQQQICTTLTATAQEITQQAQLTASNTLGEISQLMASVDKLVSTRLAAETDAAHQHTARMNQLTSLMQSELSSLRDEEAQRGHAAVERLTDLQTVVTRHLTHLGTALEDPIKRLIETASEAPRAAAEVIGQLRQEMSSGIARDNELLQERSRILETLNSLLAEIHHASSEQRAVIDTLVTTSAAALDQVGSQFAQRLESETSKLGDIAAQVTGGAVEVSSLGETFSFAVQAFSAANESLVAHLQRIEAALDKSMLRSDEQLAYYVAQAREIIDLSTLSQKEIFEELRRLPSQQARSSQEVS
ncbi:DUF802 domain-containing protein [Rhodoferax sp.]|uniref:DUF802 domain-containing protein n=1 Tax=Rhodoferax sp. TaxID=50421 RepID=UPI002841D768|nr:DUF802 domain-containing protein [Rhodoferax sp.]MDR3369162.1 DUF802 domain-containing protein [Rhodoferax sp.]